MIIDTTKPFSEQTEEVQEEIRELLQSEMQRRYQAGEGYPEFDNDGGITISVNYTDNTGNNFKLSEKRVQEVPFSEEIRRTNFKYHTVKKL